MLMVMIMLMLMLILIRVPINIVTGLYNAIQLALIMLHTEIRIPP
jgi:ABC-type sulfate transport system permease subunit